MHLAEPTDYEFVTVRAIWTEDIENHRSLVGVNDLPDAQQWFAPCREIDIVRTELSVLGVCAEPFQMLCPVTFLPRLKGR